MTTDSDIDPAELLNDDGNIDARALGRKKAKNSRPVSHEECAMMRRRAANGASTREIAEDLGRWRTTVRDHLTGRQCIHDGNTVGEPTVAFDHDREEWVPEEDDHDE